MFAKLFDVQNGVVIPTEHCYTLAALKDDGGNSFLQHAVGELDFLEIKKLLGKVKAILKKIPLIRILFKK